jgi:nitric oxide reductase subunit C
MHIHLSGDRQRVLVLLILLFFFLCYSFYLYTNLPVKRIKQDRDAAAGKLSWQKYNCNACHQVYGLGGYLGPDLTNVYSVRGPAYIEAFLKNGTGIMPDFHLKQGEIKNLLGFFRQLNASGKSDPKTFMLSYEGTIEQK